MKTSPLFFCFLIFFASCASLAMDQSSPEELKELYRRQEDEKFIPKLHTHITQAKEFLQRKHERCQRICEQRIAGCDWVSFCNHKVTLRADVAYVAPFHEWELYNCVIRIENIKPRFIELTIIPNVFPVLSDDKPHDATWKAIVWLVAKEQHLNESERADIEQKIEQLELCQKNLQRHYKEMLEQATKNSDSVLRDLFQ